MNEELCNCRGCGEQCKLEELIFGMCEDCRDVFYDEFQEQYTDD